MHREIVVGGPTRTIADLWLGVLAARADHPDGVPVTTAYIGNVTIDPPDDGNWHTVGDHQRDVLADIIGMIDR